MAYTNEEYYDMLMALGECHGQYHVAVRRYTELYPNRARHPSAAVILPAAQRLYETGSVLLNKQVENNTVEIFYEVDQNPRFPSYVIFSDESFFTQEGIFNTHNMHLEAKKIPESRDKEIFKFAGR